MNKNHEKILRLVAAAGLVGGTANMASAQAVVNISGATLFESFFAAPASTNDFIDADGDGFARKFLTDDQLAPFGLPPSQVLGQNGQWWTVQYRSVGSVNGIQELVNWGKTFAVNPTDISSSSTVVSNAYLNRQKYVNNGALTGAADVNNPGAAPLRANKTTLQARYQLYNNSTEGVRIDLSVADVPTSWGVFSAGLPAYARKPATGGYGRNPAFALNKDGTTTTTDNLLANIGALNTNTVSPDANTIFDCPIAAVPIAAVTNLGTGKQTATFTELQFLFTTGRNNTGENLMVVTRDSGSGTRNGFMNSICIDPSWGVGDNVGASSAAAAENLLGANFIPNNKTGSGGLESAVLNHRLAIGYTGAERGASASWLTAGRIEILGVKDDINGGTEFARPYIDRVLDNGLKSEIDPSTGLNYPNDGYRIGGIETFGAIGDPDAAPAAKGGTLGNTHPQMANVEAAAYVNNIRRSIAAFDAAPGSDNTLFTPAEFLGTNFILVAASDKVQSLTNPCLLINNADRNQFLQDFVRGISVLKDNGYKTFGTYTLNGKVPARTTGVVYSDGVANGANYVSQSGASVTYGAGLTTRNRISGDFNGDGLRNRNDTLEMLKAWRQRNGGPAWTAPNGTGAIAGALGTDAVIEILGDFDGNGSFGNTGGPSTPDLKDVRYFADGLAMDPVTGKLDRKAAFTQVDTSWQTLTGGSNFFGTTLATSKPYAAGDSRGDVAKADGRVTPGFAPIGADGAVNGFDIDYVFKQFRRNANVGDCQLNWDNLAEAIGGDLSADIDGNLTVDQADACELVTAILGTSFGDVNLDGTVNGADLAIVTANQGTSGGWAQGDMNGDGVINDADLRIVDGSANGCCPADFNNDGFVSGDDFDSFVALFELGDPAADFNGDGFVTGDDFDLYNCFFTIGC